MKNIFYSFVHPPLASKVLILSTFGIKWFLNVIPGATALPLYQVPRLDPRKRADRIADTVTCVVA